MQTRSTILAAALAIFSVIHCVGRAGKGEADLTPFALLGALSLTGMPAPATHASTAPTVNLPSSVGLPESAIQVTESSVELPAQIDGTFVPVGKVYDVGPDTQGQDIPGHLYLPEDGVATLTYEYDPDELKAAGFLEEFAAFYYDREQGEWLPVDKIEVDASSLVVRVYTTHFTPFVLTAVPAASGGIANPPACIAEDFPSGMSGSAGAEFTIVDTDFKYYRDRGYTIDRTGGSFDALGFNGALGISTCNGDSFCGSFANHKLNSGTNYIQFTAHTNIDLYLMYDTRGGAHLYDDTRDAPWIKASGFVNTGEFIETSDAVGKYRVYKKSYNKGELVSLDGNRAGVTAHGNGIQTNYWLVMKRQGVTGAEPASKMCEQKPSLMPSFQVSSVRIAPGANQMILGFQTPDHPDFAGVVIRRSTTAAPARIGDGIAATGTVLSPGSYRDESLAFKKQYFYTIFALDKNGAYGPGVSISAATGKDTDADGLSDAFEKSTPHESGLFSDPDNAQTDGDGISDGLEVAAGTDPTDADSSRPVVTDFQLTTQSVTNDPLAAFQLDAADNIAVTGWAITRTDTPPVSWGTNWTAAKPESYSFSHADQYSLYAWVKDAAGNVSLAVSPLAVNLEGINETRYAIVTIADTNQVESYSIDPVTGVLTLISTVDLPYNPYLVAVHPSGKFAYTSENGASSTLLSILTIDQATGQLSLVQNMASGGTYPYSISFDEAGKYMYVTHLTSNTLTWFSTDASSGTHTYQGSVATGSKPVFGLTAPGNHLYVSNTGSDQIWHYTLNPVTGAPSNPYNAMTTASPRGLGRTPDSAFLFSASNDASNTTQRAASYSVNPATGGLSTTSSPNGGQYMSFFAVHPNGRLVYVTDYLGGAVTGFDFDPQTGLTNTRHFAMPGRPLAIEIHSNGRFAFVTSYDGFQIMTYRIDPATGTLFPASAVTKTGRPHYLGLQAQHDGNDPPAVNAGQDRWTTVGQSAALHGHNTSDPDAARCNADPSNYSAAWTIVSKPAGSTLTDADIVDANTLGSARFVPDVSGDYQLRLAFTDHPGSCQGSAKTRADEVTIRAGYQHSQAVNVYDQLPAPPRDNAVFVHNGTLEEDWGGDMLWAVTVNGDPVQYIMCLQLRQHFGSICTNASSWLNPPRAMAACAIRNVMDCEAQFRLNYNIICLSPEMNRPEAQRHCEDAANGRPPVFVNGNQVYVDLNRGHFWTRSRMRMHYIGQYNYWDYN